MGVVSIQLAKNCAAAGLYLLLRLLLQVGPEQTRRPIIRVRKLRILLSLLAIPTSTALYIDDVMRYVPFSFMLPPLPVSVYIACLAWLVIDVLWQFRKLQHEIVRGPIIDGTAESFQNRL